MEKRKRLFVLVILIIISILFISIISGVLFRKQITNRRNEKTRSKSSVLIKWEELYPFSISVEIVDSVIDQGVSFLTTSYIEKIINLFKKVSARNWAVDICIYNDLARIGYIINSKLTDPSIGTTYVKLKNGYWITRSSKQQLSDSNKKIIPYASLQKYCNDKDIDFLYFYAPLKECSWDDELPDGIVSYTNANIDMDLEVMDSYKMDYVDLRKNLHNDALDHYQLFYITDHHWTVEAGLWAASKITQEINKRFGYSMIDPYSLGSYNNVKYEKAEFGSMGDGLTKHVAKPEDFIIPYPQFETRYRLEIPNKEIDVSGSFEELFIDHDRLKVIVEQGGGAAYGTILYGNPPYQKISNLNNSNGPKVLMIRDSFSTVVAPYLVESCSELLMLDTRPDNGYFTGSIIGCINQFNPDIVIILQCSPQSITLNKE